MSISDIVKVKADGSLVVITDIEDGHIIARPVSKAQGTQQEDTYAEEDLEAVQAEYKIPVTWSMAGIVKVMASSASEAVSNFEHDMEHIPLPEGEYIDASFEMTETDEEDMHLFQ